MNSNLKRKVMLRIYAEFWKQSAIRNLQYIAPIALFFSLLTFVSIGDILVNLSSAKNLEAIYGFVIVALRDTELAVQITLGALLLSLLVPIARRVFSIPMSRSVPAMRAS